MTQDEFGKAVGAKPVVDFDYFRFSKPVSNYEIARKLVVVLMAFTDIDQLHGLHDEESWPSTVGTGGSGWNFACPSQAAQRSCLASLFSSYVYQRHQSCHMGLPEYQCLKDLLRYLEEEYNPMDHQSKLINEGIEAIKMTCKCFEQAYMREEPGFLFEILKQEQEAIA